MIFLDYCIKCFIRCLFSLLVSLKILNIKNMSKPQIGTSIIISLMCALLYSYLKLTLEFNLALIVILMILSFLIHKITNKNILNSITILLFSYVFCFIIYFIIGGLITAIFSCYILGNEIPTFLDYRIIDIFFLLSINKIICSKKLSQGITIFKNEKLLMIIRRYIILCSVILMFFSSYYWYIELFFDEMIILLSFLLITFITLGIFIIIWIKREMKTYYKFQANEKTIENLLSKVEEQKGEINRLTAVSKISHKTNHQIDVLKSKLIGRNCDDILLELNDLSKKYHEDIELVNKKKLLQSTKVEKLDEILEHILNEASKNKIDFVIRINGSVNYMIKNCISLDKLSTLLSDHLKNSIISINHSKNPFRSITLNIGEIGNYYGIAIHDTGIEFKVNTLVNLGTKAVSTHKKDGGTGIGFLTTFDMLREIKGSLHINERKPEDYNYTKTITVLFDEKNQFKINSYRAKLINSKKKQKIIVTNKKII